MKRLAICLAVLAAAACSDGDGPGTKNPERKAPWESYTHARLLKLKGAVKTLTQQTATDGEVFTTLKASFDAAGNCLAYNPTGIDPEAVTYGWGVKSVWYEYAYDASGRMTEAAKYEVGSDPEVFRITYGDHTSYVPAPFPLGNIEPFMLKGVTGIESTNYRLTSDGSTAAGEFTGSGWDAASSHTVYKLENGFPASALTATNRNGAEVSRTSTVYTYDRNWLARLEETTTYTDSDGSDTQITLTEFSDLWPCTRTAQQARLADNATPEYRMEYAYGENGLPKSATYVQGSFFEQEFEQHYNAYDAVGNWTSSTKASEGQELTLTQQPVYF